MMFLKIIFGAIIAVIVIMDGIALILDGPTGTLVYHLLFRHKSGYKNSRDTYADADYFGYSRFPHQKIKEFPTINFEQFRDFYYLNKDSWDLYEYFVQKDKNKNMVMTFTYPEWRKYHKFYVQVQKNKEREKENQKQQEITKEKNRIARCVLESVQKDIDVIRAEQQQDLNEAIELVKGVKL